MRNTVRFWIAALAVGWAAAAQAVNMTPLSIEELGRAADVILRGSVAGKTCLRDEAGRIYTRIDFQVSEVWKGRAEGVFPIAQAGGTLGGERVVAMGQVGFALNEEAVVFLKLNARGEGVVIGLSQGKFALQTDAASGEKIASSVFYGGGEAAAFQRQTTGLAPAGKLTAGRLKELALGTGAAQ